MNTTRRDLAFALAALSAGVARAESAPKLGSKVYLYADLKVRQNGENKSRAVLNGVTHSGYPVEMHITDLAPGQAPHPPHRHIHEEMMLLKNGVLEATINGETTRMTPGSVVFIGSNDLHGLKNPGPERAEYFVIALGSDT